MYESFYGLREKPFSLLPDPAYLYLSDKHQMALSLLEYSFLNQAGFCVISGATGAGKTTLIRHLLNQFGDHVSVGLITNTHQSFGELLRWILMAFNLNHNSDSQPQLYQTFVNFLIEQYGKNRNTILIVDEAQNMSVETLEELRMLSNINTDKDQVLQIILVGQPGLRDKLRCPELEQFAQRIAVDYHLEPLNQEEAHNYIRHRLKVAGGDPEIFTKDASDAVYRHSGGTPRLINLLCESTLVYGYVEGVTRLPAQLVDDVARERQANGLLPRMGSPRDTPATMPAHTSPDTATPMEAVSKYTLPAHEQPTLQPKAMELGVTAAADADVSARAMQGHASASSPLCAADIAQATAQENHDHIDIDVEVEMDVEQSIPVAVQMAATGPVRAGVISKLIRLDTWPRATGGNSGAGGRHITRTQVTPSVIETIKLSKSNFGQERGLEVPVEGRAATATPVDTITPHPSAARVSNPASISAISRKQNVPDADSTSRKQHMGSGGKWIVAGSVGFSMGLLAAVVLFSLAYFKSGVTPPAPQAPMSVIMPPPVAPLSPRALDPVASRPAESAAPQPMLEALQRERDAAIAQTKALERERDAVLAAARAREQANTAALGAAQARTREKAATLEALKAQERARTAELEAIAARERERAAAIEAANVQVRKFQTEAKSQAETKAALDEGAPAARAVETEPRTEAKAAPVPAAGESAVKFSANPCKGPSAKFLSTCKE